jgi:hypothetical protein
LRRFLICLLAIVPLFSDAVNAEHELPSWVPEQALLTAQRKWDTWMKEYDVTSLWCDFGLTSTSEALSCVLKNPYRVLQLDYDNYTNDRVLSTFLSSSRVPHDSAYGFGIYHGDNVVGHICVYYKDNFWRLMELRGYGNSARGDFFAPIYDRYPIASGYVIYREDWTGTFFVFKNGNFIEAYAKDNLGDGLYESIEPREYLRREKDRIMKVRETYQK